MKITKKSLLNTLSGNTCTSTMIGGRALEDWDGLIENLKKEFENVKVTADRVDFGNGPPTSTTRYFLKPRFNRVRTGTFSVKGTKYIFDWDDTGSSGYIADLRVGETGQLEMKMLDGAVLRYELIQP